MQWIQVHGSELLEIIGAVVTVATLIVKLTPTSKDDQYLAKVIRILSAFSLCNSDGSFIGKDQK